MSLLERLKGRFAQQQKSAAERYAWLVDAEIAGTVVAEDEALTILSDAGKSVEQLAADVEDLRNVQAWQDTIDAYPAARQEYRAATVLKQQQDATFDAAMTNLRDQYKADCEVHRLAQGRFENSKAAAEAARGKIVERLKLRGEYRHQVPQL